MVNGGAVPKKLADAVKAVGTVVNTSPPSRPKDRQEWISEHIASAGLRIKPDAAAQLGQWLGEDAGRLDGILETLTSTYGADHVLTFADVEPFLGEAGGVPPWDFTDAIDRGDTTKALTLLGRMMHAGGRHPLQIMAILHSHYSNLAKLDGVEARTEADAVAATGIKAPFPAKKALQTYNRLGAGVDQTGDRTPRPGRSRPARRQGPGTRAGDGGARRPPVQTPSLNTAPKTENAWDSRAQRATPRRISEWDEGQPAALTFFIRRLFWRAAGSCG